MKVTFQDQIDKVVVKSIVQKLYIIDDESQVQESLRRLRYFSQIDPVYSNHLIYALSFLKEADHLADSTKEDLADEWRLLSGFFFANNENAGAQPVESNAAVGWLSEDSPVFSSARQHWLCEPKIIRMQEPLEPWYAVEGSELTQFLKQVPPIDGRYPIEPSTTKVAWCCLSFYDGAYLVRIADFTWEEMDLIVYYLAYDGDLFRLKGTPPPINEMNKKVPLNVNEENILDYLRFFCFFVRGSKGPFLVTEEMDAPYICQIQNRFTRFLLERSVHRTRYKGMNSKGNFLCEALIYYYDSLFSCNFEIQPSGMVDMLDDELIAASLAEKISAPI